MNPDVPHPALEPGERNACSGTNERVPTQIYNGYGDYVAGLYAGLKGESLFM